MARLHHQTEPERARLHIQAAISESETPLSTADQIALIPELQGLISPAQ